jgi:UDP-glucuronate decarboxylase
MAGVRRVLVTGASGFIGQVCTRLLLARGFEVHGTGRAEAPSIPGLVWHQANLLTSVGRERAMAVRPSHLLHLAWEARPGLYRDSPDNAAWAEASLDLLDRALSGGARRIFGIGSCFEYGPFDGPCGEVATPCRPETTYGRAKLATAQGFVAAGAAWGRVFFPFGPGEPRAKLLPSLILSLAAGQDFPCSAGDQIRDFIFVEDLADAVVSVLESGAGGVINLGSGEGTSLKQIIQHAAQLMGRADLVRFGARTVSGPDAERLIVADIDRLRHEISWTPKIGWAAGVERSIAWWRQRRPDPGT